VFDQQAKENLEVRRNEGKGMETERFVCVVGQ